MSAGADDTTDASTRGGDTHEELTGRTSSDSAGHVAALSTSQNGGDDTADNATPYENAESERIRAMRLGCEQCGYVSDIPRGYGVEQKQIAVEAHDKCDEGFASPEEHYRMKWHKAQTAVEAVRAFPSRPYSCPWLSCHDNQRACIQCDAYRDGVEAVQALLEDCK